jgi:lycopene cyclase domain-containing protein
MLFVRKLKRPSKNWWITLGIVLLLTLIFDNLAIWAGFFSYNPALILGIRVGLAPLEDFFYAVMVCLIVPLLLERFQHLGDTTS